MRSNLFQWALAATVMLTASVSPAAERCLVYFGTFAKADQPGIFVHELDQTTGALKPLGAVDGVARPGFLAINPKGTHLYATSRQDGKPSGAVSAYTIDRATGGLKSLNQQSSGGEGPCHVCVDHSGSVLLVANYGSGSVASLPIKSDGSLAEPASVIQHEGSSVNPKRQQGPHAHSINVSPDNQFAYAADLGADKVFIYKLNSRTGKLTPNGTPFAEVNPGGGPRHFTFHPTGRYAYVINELQSTVTGFSYDSARGRLVEFQTISTLPEGFEGTNSTAEVQAHPSGKFLYGSNRGHNSIAVFAVNSGTGELTLVEQESTQGSTPRNFGIDPSGKFLLAANQATNNVVVFSINQQTGELDPTGHEIKIPTPVCVKFLEVE